MPENTIEMLGRDAIMIRAAFNAAQLLRPYTRNEALCAELTPPGGHWEVRLGEDGQNYGIYWHGRFFAGVNALQSASGEIAMAFRSAPTMDAALRTILALAKATPFIESAKLDLIARIAEAVIARVEEPAPRPPQTMENEDEEDNG